MADGEEAATEYTIGWEPQPGPQTALLACPVFEVFFGGARGGGKTDGMLGEWASHADLHGKNAVGLMVRRERVQLLETIERSRQIYGPIGARYNDQDKMWRWPNGARLRFAYLERDADADAYQGHSYTRVYVEELGTFPSASPVLRLMATLRKAAITWGMLPARTVERSSSKVTSRTQCSLFSMCQSPRCSRQARSS